MKKFQLTLLLIGFCLSALSQQLNWINAGGGPLNDATRTVTA
jgi:hypothetical protein